MVSDSCKKRFGKIMMEEMELVAQEEIAPRIYSMILKGEMVAQMLPGQFLHIRVPDGAKLLRRPISISEIDRKTQTCRLIYRIEGGGTAIFSQLPIGSKLSVMGPQGNGFDLTNLGQGQKALIIGGGIGVPPLVQVAKQLHEQGVEVEVVVGFATRSLMLSILVEPLVCSNMSIPNFMTILAPIFPWNRVWLVGWVLAMPVWCI